jgi:hypothetical protein
MDWLANLGLKESDIDFTSSKYCPQYPQKEGIGDIGDIIPAIENENNLDTDESLTFCASVMPEHFYNGGNHDPFYGDAEFILSELLKYPTELRKLIAVKYSHHYQCAYHSCHDEIKQDNEARRDANRYLLRQRASKIRLVSCR